MASEPTKKVDGQKQLKYSHLIDLYKHYWSVLHTELGFCHQYLNFYSGLLSAILAATLAGLLSLKFRGLDELTLLIGPILIGVLAYNGYNTVKTFYKRFVEVWVTTLNLESMLGIRYSHQASEKPRYVSRYESFMPTMDDEQIMDILEDKEQTKKGGPEQAKTAEQVAKELRERKKHTTLVNAKITFITFGVAAVALAVFIILTMAFPSLFQ
jgi:hypothetical protein